MHASEGIQDPLAGVSEDPDEALECFKWLLAIVEWDSARGSQTSTGSQLGKRRQVGNPQESLAVLDPKQRRRA